MRKQWRGQGSRGWGLQTHPPYIMVYFVQKSYLRNVQNIHLALPITAYTITFTHISYFPYHVSLSLSLFSVVMLFTDDWCIQFLKKCHVVNFEFTGWVLIQNLNQVVNFVFTPTQLIQHLQHDKIIHQKCKNLLKLIELLKKKLPCSFKHFKTV